LHDSRAANADDRSANRRAAVRPLSPTPPAYETYRQQVPALIAAHGGRYLVRGGAVEVLEGDRVPRRQVIL